MNIDIPLIITTISGLATLLGSLFVFLPKFHNKYLCMFLTLSAVIMIGISLFDLLPNGLPIIYDTYHFFSIVIIVILIIISSIIINLIDGISSEEKGSLYSLGIISMIILVLHNVPEGIITFLSSYINNKIGIKISIAIAMHNIPEGIMISIPIYYATKSKYKAFKSTLIASLSEPIGGLIGFLIFKRFITKEFIAVLLILVAGLMVNLATKELIPKIKTYYDHKYVLLGLIVGIISIIINMII